MGKYSPSAKSAWLVHLFSFRELMGDYVDIDRRLIPNSTVRVLDGAYHRPTSPTTCLELNNGRRVIYFSQRVSGPSSTCPVTNNGFVASYASGSSTLGGSDVSWVSGSVTVPADSLRYLGVSSSGEVSLYTDIQNDMAPIAALRSNSATIVEIYLYPPIGNYVYQYAQILDGEGGWTWSGTVILPLSSGEAPRATYDISLDKISLTYTKDDSTYRREVASGTDVSSLYWLKDYSVAANQVLLNDLKQSVPLSSSAAVQNSSLVTHSNSGYYFLTPYPREDIPVGTSKAAYLSPMVIQGPGVPVRLSSLSLSNHYRQIGLEMIQVPLVLSGIPVLSGGYQECAIDSVILLRPDGSLADEYPYSSSDVVDVTPSIDETGTIGFGVRSRVSFVPGSSLRVPYVSTWAESVQFPSILPSDPSSLAVRTYPSSSYAAEQSRLTTHSDSNIIFLQPYPLDTVRLSSSHAGYYSSMTLT